jgi:hypothetical protein
MGKRPSAMVAGRLESPEEVAMTSILLLLAVMAADPDKPDLTDEDMARIAEETPPGLLVDAQPLLFIWARKGGLATIDIVPRMLLVLSCPGVLLWGMWGNLGSGDAPLRVTIVDDGRRWRY